MRKFTSLHMFSLLNICTRFMREKYFIIEKLVGYLGHGNVLLSLQAI